MIYTLKNTWAVLDKKEKNRFIVLLALDLVINIIDILSLVLLLWIIQFYIQPANSNDLGFLPEWVVDKDSVWIIVIFFFLFGIKNLVAWFISKAWYKFISEVTIRLSRLNLMTYQHSGFTEFIKTDSSVHIHKVGFQPFEFSQYILSGIPQIITQSSLIIMTITAMLIFNAKLFLLLLIILLPPVAILFYFIKRHLTKLRKQTKAGNESSFQHLLDALKGYVESNIYGVNDFFLRRFANSRKKFSSSVFQSINIQTIPPRIIEVFAVLGLVILIAIAKWSGSAEDDQVIIIGAFIGAAYKIIPGIVKIINLSGQVKSYENVATDFLRTKAIPETGVQEKRIPGIDSVQLKNISYQYGQEKVINNFSLLAEKGDFVVINGESGKGKTTILTLLLGFLPVSKGEVLYNNEPVNENNARNYWPYISYVKQQSFLIHDTILRNITLEENQPNDDMLQYALKMSGLDDFIKKAEEGLSMKIMENGKNISGGQRQRIAIARALYKKADMIILDEPFNELDEQAELTLLQNLKHLSQSGKIILLITHNKTSFAYCNKIISLDE